MTGIRCLWSRCFWTKSLVGQLIGFMLLARGLDCTLDRRPRLCPPDEAITDARAKVRAACVAFGLDFSAG